MHDHDPVVMRRAGHTLRQAREAELGRTQRDISKISRERWGEKWEIDQAVLSKIERGAMAKPPNLAEAALLAALYDRPLSWMADLYELPVTQSEGILPEPIALRLALTLAGLAADDPRRERLIRAVDFAIREALRREDRPGA